MSAESPWKKCSLEPLPVRRSAPRQWQAKYREMKGRIAGQPQRGDERSIKDIENWIKSIGERIKGAVKAGELSEEEARAKWAEIAGEDGDDKD